MKSLKTLVGMVLGMVLLTPAYGVLRQNEAMVVKLTSGSTAAAVSEAIRDGRPTGLPELDQVLLDWDLTEAKPVFGRAGLPPKAPEMHQQLGLDRYLILGWDAALPMEADQILPQVMDELNGLNAIEGAEENGEAVPMATVDDPEYASQYFHSVDCIDSELAWDYTTGDSSIWIAVVDSGIQTAHPDFDYSLITNGYDFIDGDQEPYDDTFMHGTAVQGMISAVGNNATDGAGLAWGCMGMPVRVYDTSGGCTVADLAAGVEYAADAGCRVINCSFSSYSYHADLDAALTYAGEETGCGCLIVASMGNYNNDESSSESYVASHPDTLAVGGTWCYDSSSSYYYLNNWRWDFTSLGYGSEGSEYGSYIDVVAPASPICTTYDNSTFFAYGTSFSAPLVSGLAGLLLSIEPGWGPTYTRWWIQWGALDGVGDPSEDTAGWDEYMGYGLIDVGWTVEQAALGTNCPLTEIAPYEAWEELWEEYLSGGAKSMGAKRFLMPFYRLRDEFLKPKPKGAELVETYYAVGPAIVAVMDENLRLKFDLLALSRKVGEVIPQLWRHPDQPVRIPRGLWAESIQLADRVMPRLPDQERIALAPWLQAAKQRPLGLLQDLGISAVWAPQD